MVENNQDIVLETNHLTKTYGNQVSVENLSVHLKKGRIYGLLGKNGAGKSTTMKMILGLAKASSGEIFLFGQNMQAISKRKLINIYSKIGNTIESPGFYPNLTGTENLRIFANLRGISEKTVAKILKQMSLPYQDKKLFSEYSLGMKQRLAIANAIINKPELLILDEPTNGLDPDGIIEIRELLLHLSHDENTTILISSHILSEIQLIADDIGIISDGKLLVEAPLNDLMQKANQTFIFTVSDPVLANQIIKDKFSIESGEIDRNNLKIKEKVTHPEVIIKEFVQNGINITSAYQHSDTLESYFESLTGGGNHA